MESERGGGHEPGAHDNAGGGRVKKKRLLEGHAARAAERHRQRVALQQAAREQRVEEGVTYSVGAPLRKHSVKKVDRPDRVEGAKKRHRLAGRASPTPPSGRLIRHKALVKSHS